MTKISKEEVERIADLARLAVSEDEIDSFTSHLESTKAHADKLKELDTEGVKPTTHMLDLKNVMRQDKPEKWTTQEEVLKNAPDHQDGQFRVPAILE